MKCQTQAQSKLLVPLLIFLKLPQMEMETDLESMLHYFKINFLAVWKFYTI